MTFEDFDKFQRELFEVSLGMNDTKGREYAGGSERFANFERLAQQLGLSRQKVLWVYLAKHLDAIVSIVNNGRTFSEETARGRIVDAITYLSLLGGMWAEDAGSVAAQNEQNKTGPVA